MNRFETILLLNLLFFALYLIPASHGTTKSLSVGPAPGNSGEWLSLFNGNNLQGWRQLNGKAKYEVINGEIVGTTVYGTPNSFLCTEQEFGDFILEFEVIVDPDLNSGVQIRSESLPTYREGRVHGYQVEIDPSQRAFSGGIYDEARRGWLYPLSRNPKGRTAFRNGRWNHFRVEAIGNSLKTWINGVQTANLVDDMTAKGFIALQVHSVNKAELGGKLVKWRNIRIKTADLESDKKPDDPEVVQLSYLINKLSDLEVRQGWRLLWDGLSSAGWRGAKLDHFPESGWVMRDGALTVLGTDGRESTGPGDIITDQLFSSFELELEFKITEGANSGIKYFVDPTLNKGTGSAIGCEFQILDDRRHPDATRGVQGNRRLGSLYDLIPAENLSVPGRSVQFKGVGAWNKARIVVRGGQVEHWLNNEKIVEYNRYSQIFTALVAYSKYQDWPHFGQWPSGHILLQDHGNTVHFRSIKIREF
jgi:hypothetical protein